MSTRWETPQITQYLENVRATLGPHSDIYWAVAGVIQDAANGGLNRPVEYVRSLCNLLLRHPGLIQSSQSIFPTEVRVEVPEHFSWTRIVYVYFSGHRYPIASFGLLDVEYSESDQRIKPAIPYVYHFLNYCLVHPSSDDAVRTLKKGDAYCAINAIKNLLENTDHWNQFVQSSRWAFDDHLMKQRRLLRLMRKLAHEIDGLPSSLYIRNITLLRQISVVSGGYGDIFEATHASGRVALKRLKVLGSRSGDEDDLKKVIFLLSSI